MVIILSSPVFDQSSAVVQMAYSCFCLPPLMEARMSRRHFSGNMKTRPAHNLSSTSWPNINSGCECRVSTLIRVTNPKRAASAESQKQSTQLQVWTERFGLMSTVTSQLNTARNKLSQWASHLHGSCLNKTPMLCVISKQGMKRNPELTRDEHTECFQWLQQSSVTVMLCVNTTDGLVYTNTHTQRHREVQHKHSISENQCKRMSKWGLPLWAAPFTSHIFYPSILLCPSNPLHLLLHYIHKPEVFKRNQEVKLRLCTTPTGRERNRDSGGNKEKCGPAMSELQSASLPREKNLYKGPNSSVITALHSCAAAGNVPSSL